jgi:hypothetical protein
MLVDGEMYRVGAPMNENPLVGWDRDSHGNVRIYDDPSFERGMDFDFAVEVEEFSHRCVCSCGAEAYMPLSVAWTAFMAEHDECEASWILV